MIAAMFAALLISLLLPASAVAAAPEGVWLVDGKVALEIFDCDNQLCGRIRWLKIPRDQQGVLKHDKNNAAPELRPRALCGLRILSGLRSESPDRWSAGQFYNPDDGTTYDVNLELTSADVITARIYQGLPVLGKTKTLSRVPRETSEGWC